jgi:hypothetical protein
MIPHVLVNLSFNAIYGGHHGGMMEVNLLIQVPEVIRPHRVDHLEHEAERGADEPDDCYVVR